MTSEYAPASIVKVFERLVELRPNVAWVCSGIVGDASHTYGYHRARAMLPPRDYSVVLPRDQGGPDWAAAALDITPPDATHQMRLTRRLARATRAKDPHLFRVVREWYGSLDGRHVAGYDLARDAVSLSDVSHLTHVHISFFRENLARPALLRPVADILAGPGADEG